MYNEEGNIRPVVASAFSVLSEITPEFEIVIVNDGSTDKTLAVAHELAASDPRIRVVNHEKNLGYGAALRSGLAACKYDLIFQCDGDSQFDIREIHRLLPYINDFDFVVGYRIKRMDPAFRKLEALFYRTLLRVMFGLKLRDTNCAFKLFKKKITDQLKLETSGAIINGEIFIKARKLGYTRIKEIGVNHYPRKVGSQTGAKPGVLWDALISIISLWIQTRK